MNLIIFQLGQQYGIKQMPFSEYIEDIKSNKKRALKSYLAVQNIKKALPMLEVVMVDRTNL